MLWESQRLAVGIPEGFPLACRGNPSGILAALLWNFGWILANFLIRSPTGGDRLPLGVSVERSQGAGREGRRASRRAAFQHRTPQLCIERPCDLSDSFCAFRRRLCECLLEACLWGFGFRKFCQGWTEWRGVVCVWAPIGKTQHLKPTQQKLLWRLGKIITHSKHWGKNITHLLPIYNPLYYPFRT